MPKIISDQEPNRFDLRLYQVNRERSKEHLVSIQSRNQQGKSRTILRLEPLELCLDTIHPSSSADKLVYNPRA